jgi:aspartate aminotransferase-like enzyme
MIISNGYGDFECETFRIADMGDTQVHELDDLFTAMDGFFA